MPTASNLDKQIAILELDSQHNVWAWAAHHDTMAQIARLSRRSIFSHVALSAVALELVVRSQKVGLQNSILWEDKQLYITEVERQRHFVIIDNRMDAVESKPAKRWEKVIDTVLAVIVTAVIAFMLGRFGF